MHRYFISYKAWIRGKQEVFGNAQINRPTEINDMEAVRGIEEDIMKGLPDAKNATILTWIKFNNE